MRFDGRPESLEILREIAENILDPVFLVDRNFNVWYYNRAFEQAVGVRMSSRQYKDRPCYELLGLAICKNACIMKQAVSLNKTVRLAEIQGLVAGGEHKNFHINAIPVTGADGQAFGSLNILRDITVETQIHEKYKQLVTKNSAMALSGSIEAGNLIDVIQLFIFLQKTGQLTLTRNKVDGVILFERGQMAAIKLGDALNAKALDQLLSWPDGQFAFSPKVTAQLTERISGSADFMLMDAVREKDEIGAKREQVPSPDTRPQVLRLASQEEEGMAGTLWRVYELALEGKNVGQILTACPDSESKTLLALLSLRDKQVLSW